MTYSALKKKKLFFLSDKNLAMMTENYMSKQTQNHCLQLFSGNQFLMIQGKYVIQCIENTLLRLLLFTNIISHNTYCYITYRVALLCKIPKVNVHVFSKLK